MNNKDSEMSVVALRHFDKTTGRKAKWTREKCPADAAPTRSGKRQKRISQAAPARAQSQEISTDTPDRYGYEPLAEREIRVLYLEPGTFDQPLRGRLQHVSLDDVEQGLHQYEAISYAWGEPIFPHSIVCNGYSVRLTESLYQALKYFRLEESEKSLWADAICISQADYAERSHQVGMMGDIYKSAAKVLAWLGESEPEDALAFATIRAVTTIRERSEDLHVRNEVDRQATEWLDTISEHIQHDECFRYYQETSTLSVRDKLVRGLEAVARLSQRKYFTRLWIVQEIAFATHSEICVGLHSETFSSFYGLLETCALLQSTTSRTENPFSAVIPWLEESADRLNRIWSFSTERSSRFDPERLLATLWGLRTMSVSDSRDRLNAMYALLNLSDVPDMAPGYSVPTVKAEMLLVKHILLTSKVTVTGPTFLALVGTEDHSAIDNSRPSWLASIGTLSLRSEMKFNTYFYSGRRSPRAGKLVSFRARSPESSPETIWIRGMSMSLVKEICTRTQNPREEPNQGFDETTYWEMVNLKVIPWYHRCRAFILRSCEADYSEIEFRQILHQGLIHSYRTFEYPPLERFNTHLSGLLAENPKDPDANDHSHDLLYHRLVPVLSWQSSRFHDRRRLLCRTESGHIGWMPTTARTGDVICVFAGAPFPFLLRDDGDNHYKLIGDAYIHGIMKGEAMPEDRSELEWIKLR